METKCNITPTKQELDSIVDACGDHSVQLIAKPSEFDIVSDKK